MPDFLNELEIQLVIYITDLVISEWPFVLLQKVRMVKNLFRTVQQF